MTFKLKSFFANLTLLNTGLLICLIIFAHYVFPPFFNFQTRYAVPRAKGHPPGNYEVTSSESHVVSPADYAIVAEENLFHPERKIPPEKKEEAPPLPKPDLVLYGTLITDNFSLAYLEDLKEPRNTPGRGKRQIALKKGDMLNGFTLEKIEPDKIVMVRAEERLTVSVQDSHRRNTKAPVAAQPPGSSRPSSALDQLRSSRQQEKIETKIIAPRNAEEQSIINAIEKSRGSN